VIITALDGAMLFYRAHSPQWASQPLSGSGAARHGGRLNRPGVNALYLADSQTTAIGEYQQLDSLMPPCTLVTYRIVIQRVVDFRAGYAPTTGRHYGRSYRATGGALLERIEPPSWVLADEVRRAGHAGVLFPSIQGNGVNLVVYSDALGANDVLRVYDPGNSLPRNQRSWAPD